MPLKPKIIQIEKVPESSDAAAWAKFNERVNDLVNHGYTVSCTTDTYILLSRKPAAIRREE